MILNDCVYVDFGDCRELLKKVESESVAVVVTSPPYNIGKPYGKYKDKIALDEWKKLISETTAEIYRVLKPNGSFFLNLSPIPFGPQKEILPLPYIGYDIMKENGFYIRNIITNSIKTCLMYF